METPSGRLQCHLGHLPDLCHIVFNCCYVNGTKFVGHTQGVGFDLIACPYGMDRSHLVKHAIVLM